MYGTIFRMQVKPDQEQRAVELFNEWDRELRPNIRGAVASFVLKPENRQNELVGVAVFQDRDSYRANAGNPDQDRWFSRLRDTLQSDPQWEDGEYIAAGIWETAART